MALFGFDDDEYSLAGLMQQGHKLDVTVISSSSDDEDNYNGLLKCAKQLRGVISETDNSIMSTCESYVESNVKQLGGRMPISKSLETAGKAPIMVASSVSSLDKSHDVSLIHIYE